MTPTIETMIADRDALKEQIQKLIWDFMCKYPHFRVDVDTNVQKIETEAGEPAYSIRVDIKQTL